MNRLVLLCSFLLITSLAHTQSLLIGTTAQNPPFNSLADKEAHFYGFDIEIMSEICRRIKASCQFTPVMFNKLFTEVTAGKIDLAIAAIIITPNRQDHFLFSLPYLASCAQFLVKQQSSITSPNNLENKTIGTRRGTPFANLARSMFKNKVKIIQFPDIAALLNGLNNGTVDAIIMDEEAAKSWASNSDNLYKLIGPPIPVGEGYGIMAKPGHLQLIKQINQALLTLEADGTYLKIYSHYFGN